MHTACVHPQKKKATVVLRRWLGWEMWVKTCDRLLAKRLVLPVNKGVGVGIFAVKVCAGSGGNCWVYTVLFIPNVETHTRGK